MPSLTHHPGRINLPSTGSPSTEFDCLSIINEMDDKLNAAVIDCSTHVWNVPMVRPNQIKAAVIMCDRNGSGKTHITHIIGAIE